MDDSGGLIMSDLEFVSYRIVRLSLTSGENVLFSSGPFPEKLDARFGVRLSDVLHSGEDDIYLTPLAAKMEALSTREDGEPEELVFAVEAEIAGLFRFVPTCSLGNEMREKLILNQTAAILMPYLRGAMSGAVAAAGYGAMPMPLVNMARMAETTERKVVEMSLSREATNGQHP